MNIDFLQELCGKWPGVTTDVKWGNDYVFSVAEKMFCVSSMEQPPKIAFKVNDEQFEELSMRDGFMPAPYMARNKWVLITNPGKLSRKEWEDFVTQSYELVKARLPKKLQESLGKAHLSAEASAKAEGTRDKVQGRPKAKDTRSKDKKSTRSKVKRAASSKTRKKSAKTKKK
jgi:predicted DNA-binding protein (MmcQ/YjbR family)